MSVTADPDASLSTSAREPFMTTPSAMTTGSGPLIPNASVPSDETLAPPKGLLWIMLTNMVISINYSMLMVTGFKYVEDLGQSNLFYGAVVAAFPIGRIIFLIPVGYWSDKGQFKGIFALCNILSIIGGIMYGIASKVGSAELALAGRIVGGAGATQPVSAWAARGYPPAKRARIESMQKSMNLMGVIVGPALNAFVSGLDVTIGPFELNTETAAGYLPSLLSLILLIGMLLKVEEPPPVEPMEEGEVKENPWKILCTSGAWVCLLLAFQTNLQLAAIDTVLAKLCADLLNWDTILNSLAFGVIAILCLFGAAASIIMLSKSYRCTTIIGIGLAFNLVVSIPGMWAVRNFSVTVDPITLKPVDHMDPVMANMVLFLIMGGLQCIAIMFYTGPTGGLYQQACGKSQGLLGGVYLMFFAAGRPCGSMLGGVLLDGNPLALVFITPGFILFCLLLHAMMFRTLQRTDDIALEEQKAGRDDNMLDSLERSLSTHRFSFSGSEKGI